jgi:hypothetical protein
MNVVGTQGQLFSVDDNLIGVLMSVNDITGLPVLEVTSDYKITMGAFNRNALVVSGSSVGIGVQNSGALYRLVSSGDTLFSGGTMTVRGFAATSSSNAFVVQNSAGSLGLSITNGLVTVVHGDLQLGNTVVYWNGGSQIRNISDGVLRITNSSNSDFTRLQFGGGTTSFPSLQRSGSALCVMDASGTSLSNLLVGTTTDAGYKLDVNGTARVSGNLSVSRLISYYGVSTAQPIYIYPLNYLYFEAAGPESNNINKIDIRHNFVGSNFNGIAIQPTINQTVSTGITRGLYINPTLTSATDFRAIETSNGKIIFQNITNSATTEMLYYNSSTGLVSYGPKPSETDTLQIVSDRGRVTTSLSSTGTTLVASATTGYTGVFFNYTLGNGTSYRAGTVTSVVSSGSTVEFTETSTNDIGNTSPVSLSVGVGGGFINLSATTTTTGWTIKVVPQGI